MGLFSSNKPAFPWTRLTSIAQLDELIARSSELPVLLFKHSTTCNISNMVISRFENKWTAPQEDCLCVYLDLLAHRDISNAIAEKTGVVHQSLQAILLKDGKVIHSATHGDIYAPDIQSLL